MEDTLRLLTLSNADGCLSHWYRELLRTLLYSSLNMTKNEPSKWEKVSRGYHCHKVKLFKVLTWWWESEMTSYTNQEYWMDILHVIKNLAAEVRVYKIKCIPFFLSPQMASVIDHLIFLKWRNPLCGYMYCWVLERALSEWWTAAFCLLTWYS